MTDRTYTRLTRLAIFALADLVVILVALAMPGALAVWLVVVGVLAYLGLVMVSTFSQRHALAVAQKARVAQGAR